MTDVTAAPTVEERIKQLIDCKDRQKAMDEEHEKSKAPLKELQNLLEAWIMRFLEATGNQTSVKTASGTAFTRTTTKASVADPDIFMQHVISTNNYDLLDRRANVTAVKDYVTANRALPPGVNLTSVKLLSVNRPSNKSE